MSYTGSDMKSIIGEILEKKKADGGVKSLYFVGCGGSLGALYPAKSFMERESADIKCALISSNEFVHSTPKDFGKSSVICLACHKGNTPETIAAARLGKEKGAAVIILTWLEQSEIVAYGDYVVCYAFDASPDHLAGEGHVPAALKELQPQAELGSHRVGPGGDDTGAPHADIQHLTFLGAVQVAVVEAVKVPGHIHRLPQVAPAVLVGDQLQLPQGAAGQAGLDDTGVQVKGHHRPGVAPDPHRAALIQHRQAHHPGKPL